VSAADPASSRAAATRPGWEPPVFEVHEFHPKRTRYCFCITTLNEGERLRAQLARMRPLAALADIIIADGRSTDGSTEPRFLAEMEVRALLITDEHGLGTATRMGLAYALEQGYAGIVTVDGNGKDGVEALPDFLARLDQGYDLVQGSRFIAGAFHQNTPLERRLAIQGLMSPLLFIGCGHFYSDPTNAFRAMSARFLEDPRVQPVRRIFVRFNLQIYLICRAARLGFRLREIPVRRVYPAGGEIPTKIRGLRTKALILRELLAVIMGRCDPKN
jgi:dolichol-phosphate mannosyltransferase